MRDIIMNLNLPQETKNFLYKTKLEEDGFENINIEFFSKERGYLRDVLEWTKINDSSLKLLDEKDVKEFLDELEKFRVYYVIADNYNSGNLIVIEESTGEIYELEHEVIEEVEKYFVNSSFAQMYDSMEYFKEMKTKTLQLKKQENFEEIELLFEKAEKDFTTIDSKVVINDDEYNRQFWNETLESYREWLLD